MLRLIDVSSYIWAGMTTKFGEQASYKGIPTGGVYGLLQQVAICIKEGDIPVLIFDSPTNARDILPEYKGSRSRNPKVRFQQELVYRYIAPAIVNSFKVSGYEADWIASNFMDKYRGKVTQCVSMRTVDYDWCHNIVTDLEVMVPAVKGYSLINSGNFQNAFSGDNYLVPLNSITAKKVFFGDNSDGVSEFIYTGSYSKEQLLNAYIAYCRKSSLDTRDKESMLDFVSKMKSIFGDKYQYLINRIEVLYPRKMSDTSCLELNFTPVNVNMLSKICSLTGCKSIAGRLGIQYYEDMGTAQSELYKEYIQSYANMTTSIFEESTVKNDNINTVVPDRGGFIL